jgi:hypothetical protein
MKNTHGSSCNLVLYKVQMYLDVLGVLMLYRIRREINKTYIVIVEEWPGEENEACLVVGTIR